MSFDLAIACLYGATITSVLFANRPNDVFGLRRSGMGKRTHYCNDDVTSIDEFYIFLPILSVIDIARLIQMTKFCPLFTIFV